MLAAAARKLQHFYAIDPRAKAFLSKQDLVEYLPELVCIAAECPSLRSVLVSQMGDSFKLSANSQVSTAHLQKFELEKTLKHLSLHYCVALDEAGLFHLADKLTLQTFDAVSTPAVTLPVVLKVLQKSGSQLQRLVVQHCFRSSSSEIASSPLLYLLQTSTSEELIEIRLTDCWHWQIFHHMCTKMPQLKVLEIPEFVCIDLPLANGELELPHSEGTHTHSAIGADGIYVAGPIEWFNGYSSLVELAIGAVTNEMIARLAINAPNLKKLTLSKYFSFKPCCLIDWLNILNSS